MKGVAEREMRKGKVWLATDVDTYIHTCTNNQWMNRLSFTRQISYVMDKHKWNDSENCWFLYLREEKKRQSKPTMKVDFELE